ncbi:MAG: MarC family protein [Chlamydiia bacterium]
MNTFSIAFTLFLLMDAIGNVPLFIALLKDFDPKQQRKIIVRELLIALGIIILFAVLGEIFLLFLRIEQYTISITGGIILFLIALKMIFPTAISQNEIQATPTEPFIVPLATPFIAGPAVIASVMLYAKSEPFIVTLTAIFIAWIFTTLILMGSSHLLKFLGHKGLIAGERLMGLILTLLAVQMFLEGISSYVTSSSYTSSPF